MQGVKRVNHRFQNAHIWNCQEGDGGPISHLLLLPDDENALDIPHVLDLVPRQYLWMLRHLEATSTDAEGAKLEYCSVLVRLHQ